MSLCLEVRLASHQYEPSTLSGTSGGQGQSRGQDDLQEERVEVNERHDEESNVRRYPDRKRKKPDRLVENM